ncbi:hypothetical protein D3C74_265800 [compost metagenome]
MDRAHHLHVQLPLLLQPLQVQQRIFVGQFLQGICHGPVFRLVGRVRPHGKQRDRQLGFGRDRLRPP